MTDVIIKREMAARLARIEAAMSDLQMKMHAIRAKYAVAADGFRLLQSMIALMPDGLVRTRLLMAAEIAIGNLYSLADVLSTLVQLELAASDYAVLMCLLRDDLEDITFSKGDEPTLVSVYTKENVA